MKTHLILSVLLRKLMNVAHCFLQEENRTEATPPTCTALPPSHARAILKTLYY